MQAYYTGQCDYESLAYAVGGRAWKVRMLMHHHTVHWDASCLQLLTQPLPVCSC